MIHVNVRGLVVRKSANGKQLLIQLRKRAGEPKVTNSPAAELTSTKKRLTGCEERLWKKPV